MYRDEKDRGLQDSNTENMDRLSYGYNNNEYISSWTFGPPALYANMEHHWGIGDLGIDIDTSMLSQQHPAESYHSNSQVSLPTFACYPLYILTWNNFKSPLGSFDIYNEDGV